MNAANAQAYWGYGAGYQAGSGYTETGHSSQGNGYGYGYYGYYQAYSTGYQQGLSDAQAGLTYDCFKHTQYYCNGYSHGSNTYEKTQTQGAEVDVKGNGNYVGINQEQTSGRGVESSGYPAPEHYNNGNGNGYDGIQPAQANPSCNVICLTILK